MTPPTVYPQRVRAYLCKRCAAEGARERCDPGQNPQNWRRRERARGWERPCPCNTRRRRKAQAQQPWEDTGQAGKAGHGIQSNELRGVYAGETVVVCKEGGGPSHGWGGRRMKGGCDRGWQNGCDWIDGGGLKEAPRAGRSLSVTIA